MADKTRARQWCFTINNPNHPVDKDALLKLHEDVKYIYFQYEQGEAKTPHYQGFVIFHTQLRLAGVKKRFHATAHLQKMMGSLAQNETYCSKEEGRLDGPWWEGDRELVDGQGKRNDVKDACDAIKAGADMKTVALDHSSAFIKYSTGFSRLAMYVSKERKEMTECHILWGVPGAGKSHLARELAGEDVYWLNAPGSDKQVWWDGYHGQKSVVIDEFYGWMSFTDFKRMIDKTPYQVRYKGGFHNFNSTKVFITSNVEPESWYGKMFEKNDDHRRAFTRRITTTTHMTEVYQSEEPEEPGTPLSQQGSPKSQSELEVSLEWVNPGPAGSQVDPIEVE